MGKTEFYREQIHPDRIQMMPKKKSLLVKKYQKPVEYGSLVLPDEFLEDATGTLWELVRASPEACHELGYNGFRENDIIRTRDSFPAEDTGLDDERDGRELFIMGAEMVYNIMLLENLTEE